MMRGIFLSILRLLHKGYKLFISPLLGNVCRFSPYCSDYALEAIEKHGLIKGSWLALRRLSRCHSLNPGGSDSVP